MIWAMPASIIKIKLSQEKYTRDSLENFTTPIR
jgi:hypothetical protein